MTNDKRKRPLRFTAERSRDKHKTIEYKYNLINFYRIISNLSFRTTCSS